ncbi:hypothetical protein TRFO_19050 [Tritrichomonas foetus]|uniref:Tubby C-terminal domain-containing protein n=1 Tax=Tritrichomonas foetus TaxID=1144522 RepID=A0A1J4KK54_9EUKA|nr:hypothetical protein TRFO_19050 [Tritrichomonas foetus]|eukprot:OHT11506.1 hypothetical protein TRFO_19050 [Tritrichomonas foetus]
MNLITMSSSSSDVEMSSQTDEEGNEVIHSSMSSEQIQQNVEPVITHPNSPTVSRLSYETFISDISRSIPDNMINECIMKREKRGPFGIYIYLLFGQDQDPIFTAKNKSSPFHCKFFIYEPISGKLVGTIISDSKGLNYTVSGPESSINNFTVQYGENFLGRNGCRSFELTFSDGSKFISKPPIVINGNYYQDFHDLNTIQSIKNFVCVDKEDYVKEVCIFVRSSTNDRFTIRISRPFTLFSAFALALTSLHTGIFHR